MEILIVIRARRVCVCVRIPYLGSAKTLTQLKQLKSGVSSYKLLQLALSFTSHVLTLVEQRACNINTAAVCVSAAAK